jgi:hypothetical protein
VRQVDETLALGQPALLSQGVTVVRGYARVGGIGRYGTRQAKQRTRHHLSVRRRSSVIERS